MSFRLDESWIWDFWIADDGEWYHVFYLQAPRSLRDVELRHHHASIGHAVSKDLRQFEVVGDALQPGPEGSWDDLATWTGSIIRDDGVWHMFYTGVTVVDDTAVQRIGRATSADLMEWEKDPGPLIEADARWYEKVDEPGWPEEAWRDPWVFRGRDGRFHALITARVAGGPLHRRGVVGHASSVDLEHWEVGPPLSDPVELLHLEVLQLANLGSETVLAFSTHPIPGEPVPNGSIEGTYLVRSVAELGPFDIARAELALPLDHYSGRLVRTREGEWVWLATIGRGRDFQGELSDPIPFSLD